MNRHELSLAAVIAVLALVGGDAFAKKPDKPGKPDKSSFGKARAPLVRSGGGSDTNTKGRIDVQRRRNGSDLRIMGQRLDADLAVDIVIKRLGDNSATEEIETDFVVTSEVLADNVSTDGDGSVKVMLRTHKGDALPLEAESLDELAGARICIRVEAAENDGDDLLVGTVPLIGADYPNRVKEKQDLVPVEDGVSCTGRVDLRFRAKDVRSELCVDVKGLAEGDDVSIRMDDGEGNLVEIGTATADGDGEARYRVRTHQGDTLPFGALTVLDLQGRDIEVWVDAEFVVPEPVEGPQELGLCLTGTIPGGEE